MTRTIQTMIDQEVLVCVSGLVSTLASGYGAVDGSRGAKAHGELSDLTEQAFELASPIPDYEEAAREAGWKPSPLGTGWETREHGETIRVASAAWACSQENIEPHERKVFEHWAVTEWFAEKLEAAGEKIDRDFAGMCVWARTTTGQAIYADAVIERIYAETHRAEG